MFTNATEDILDLKLEWARSQCHWRIHLITSIRRRYYHFYGHVGKTSVDAERPKRASTRQVALVMNLAKTKIEFNKQSMLRG